MKRAALIVALCLYIGSVRAQEPVGIRFFAGSWPEALAEAQRQNKPLYVDFYTTWCPPCRRMEREAFPNQKVGEKFNAHFMNYHLNAEAGEGPEVARQYGIAGYPTALYLTPTGEVVHRATGYGGINALLQQADMVLTMPKIRRSRTKRNSR